jgi:lipopolysaccharide biosynthesis glycosyltransferase
VFGYISIATYFRLLIPSLLPPLINGPLDSLWATEMAGQPIATVSDRNLDQQRRRLGMAADSP